MRLDRCHRAVLGDELLIDRDNVRLMADLERATATADVSVMLERFDLVDAADRRALAIPQSRSRSQSESERTLSAAGRSGRALPPTT